MSTQDDNNDSTADTEDPQEFDTETTCTLCYAEFLDPEDLHIHVTQVHPAPKSYLSTCNFCTTQYTDLEAYAFHILDQHVGCLRSCQYCTKVFVDVDKFRKHERRHYCAKKNHKKCSQCAQIFDNVPELGQHEYEKHNNNLNGTLLQDYFPILSSVLNIKASVFLHILNSNESYTCGTCTYSSSDISKYVEHLHKMKCRSLACNSCSNIYKQKNGLIRHLSSHIECKEESKSSKRCTECDKDINTMFYQKHIKLCKPIKCAVCNIIFDTMNELSEHHSAEHPLSVEVTLCKFCSRQCVGTVALKKHIIRVHKGEFHLYKYKCVECDLAFKHPQKLFAHYFIKHRDLEPYTCKICEKVFRVRKQFTLHIKLDHKSVGFVEFDENYHVFFTDKKSENPFTPTCMIHDEDYLLEEEEDSHKKQPKISVRKLASLQKPNLNDLTQTETEANFTEAEQLKTEKNIKRRKRKLKTTEKAAKIFKKHKSSTVAVESSEEDDMPLLSIQKSMKFSIKKPLQLNFRKKIKFSKNNRKQLTCNQCQKYCYTYQNYQHHMSLHTKSVNKTCIKCQKDFKSKEKLNKHIKTEHSSSELTETLKNLLEKRKKGIANEVPESTMTEKFMKTIKRAKSDCTTAAATLTPVENGLSVQKFIESFTPESIEATKNNKKEIIMESCVTLKMVSDPFYRKPVIKITKFEPSPPVTNGKLSLPVKFKPDAEEKVKISVRIIQAPLLRNNLFPQSPETNNGHDDHNYSDNYDDQDHYKGDSIPEVAQEVLLEGSEEPPGPMAIPVHKIVLPDNLPKGCPDVSIAHLMPEAPFFKIVKVNEVIKSDTKKNVDKEQDVQRKDMINLPDGTKLVTVNPLAHLLGDKDVNSIMEPTKNKYYKAKNRNVENLLTKALQKASTPTTRTYKKRAPRKRNPEGQ